MKFTEKIGAILSETFNSPRKTSFVTRAGGRRVVLRDGEDYKGADLTGVDLCGAYLEKVNLEGANLAKANLSGARLRDSNLKHVNIDDATISSIDLTGSEFDVDSFKSLDKGR